MGQVDFLRRTVFDHWISDPYDPSLGKLYFCVPFCKSIAGHFNSGSFVLAGTERRHP